MNRLTDWWDDLDELERVNWVIAASIAFTALANFLLKAHGELSR